MAGTATIRPQTAARLFKISLMLQNDPRFEGADGDFSSCEASTQLRFSLRTEHRSAAASVAIGTELLWSQFPINSCSQAKQSIDPVCHFHTVWRLAMFSDVFVPCLWCQEMALWKSDELLVHVHVAQLFSMCASVYLCTVLWEYCMWLIGFSNFHWSKYGVQLN